MRAGSSVLPMALVALILGLRAAIADICPALGSERATVAAVEARLEIRLSDGRLLRLAGLDPAASTPSDPDLGETARRRLATMVVGAAVSWTPQAARPDRWGRIPAFVALDGATASGGVAAAAIGAGLARMLPEPAAPSCRDAFRSAEAAARQAKLGLWADPYYAVLAVDDHAAFAERSGTIVVAQGRLASVESGPFRTVLRFAAPAPGDRHLLAAVILPRVMKAFEAKGVMVRSLIGETLRLRGLLDLRFGPRIELAGPDDVEVVAPQGR